MDNLVKLVPCVEYVNLLEYFISATQRTHLN
jgi:hypothetical protein